MNVSYELGLLKTQLAFFWVILLLAVDSINPVKIFLQVFPQFAPWQIATICILVNTYLFVSELKSLLYFAVKAFFHSILSIFFREVEIIGIENIPVYGPVIFTGNHRNQFIDAVSLLSTCQRTLSYLVAEKSWNRKVVGHIAWAMGAVPVKRAQDSAKEGTGTAKLQRQEVEDNNESVGGNPIAVSGLGTIFTSEFKLGDKLRFLGSDLTFKVVSIENNECLHVEELDEKSISIFYEKHTQFEVLERVDQKKLFGSVLRKLGSGGAIGIFPEGGSHDRTDLLPLKAGVAIIAYSLFQKYGINVPIVPVGLNYKGGRRFRAGLYVEYGAPIYIDPTSHAMYQKGGIEKRNACNNLLVRLKDNMKAVIVTTPDYDSMKIILTARRLYQRTEQPAAQKQDLNRRFAEGYKIILYNSNGNPPNEWLEMQKRLISYQAELEALGIKCYQVIKRGNEKYEGKSEAVMRVLQILSRFARLCCLVIVASIPGLFFNFPLGYVAHVYSEARRKSALANSRVKVLAKDVLLSEKVILCIVLVPTLWLFYSLLLIFCTNFERPTVIVAIFSMPFFSYIGIMSTDAGVISLKDVRPFVIRLIPSTRKRQIALVAIRQELQSDLRRLIKKYSRSLFGDVYYEKEIQWNKIEEMSRKRSSSPFPSDVSKKKE